MFHVFIQQHLSIIKIITIIIIISISLTSTTVAEGMVKEEEYQAWKPTRQLDECMEDGLECAGTPGDDGCGRCCNGHHLGDDGLYNYCGPQTSCWGKNTLCVPFPVLSCDKCCNSWSMHLTGAYCD